MQGESGECATWATSEQEKKLVELKTVADAAEKRLKEAMPTIDAAQSAWEATAPERAGDRVDR